jgi:hypothetical protein
MFGRKQSPRDLKKLDGDRLLTVVAVLFGVLIPIAFVLFAWFDLF